MSKKTSKKIVWIKLPVNLMDDARIAELVAQKRIGGFGVYIAILMELYRRSSRCLTLTQAKAIKVHGASPTTVKAVVNDPNLFRIDQKGVVRSAIDFLEFEEEGESFTETQNGETKIDFELPAARSRVYIDKDIDKDKDLLLKAADAPDLLDQLRADDPWAEAVMMRSGFSGLLARHWTEAIRQFRLHAEANDNLRGIRSLREAKQYFSCFTTHPVTGPALRKALEAYEAQHPKENPYRFEDKGSCPGHRLYHGIPLPDEAPPRPDERADWDFAEQCWIVI